MQIKSCVLVLIQNLILDRSAINVFWITPNIDPINVNFYCRINMIFWIDVTCPTGLIHAGHIVGFLQGRTDRLSNPPGLLA